MIMTNTLFNRLSTVILGCATALILMGCEGRLPAQTVAVMVNGEPITNFDIEQRSKLITLSTHKPTERKQVIDELIDEHVKIREGKKFGIEPSAADIDPPYAAISGRVRLQADQVKK